MEKTKYQYGTSPRKIEPDYSRRTKKDNQNGQLNVVKNQKTSQVKVPIEQRRKEVKTTVTVIAIVLLLLTISCRNSQIDKKFNQIQEQKKNLAILQKENEQLKVNIENSLNLNNVEKVAKEELGMQKLTNKQIIYVTLPKKDYVESASEKVVIEEEQKSWFEQIAEKIFNF